MIVAMDKAGIGKVTSNFGDTFTLKDLRLRKLKINEIKAPNEKSRKENG